MLMLCAVGLLYLSALADHPPQARGFDTSFEPGEWSQILGSAGMCDVHSLCACRPGPGSVGGPAMAAAVLGSNALGGKWVAADNL